MELSVVMAVYNGEEFLQQAINSILSQTYEDFEFIIVNDASTDRTKDILDGVTDQRVKVIHLEENQGPGGAFNIAIDLAKGKWIALQDADDVSLPTRLEDQLRYVQYNPHLIAVSSLIQSIPGGESMQPERFFWTDVYFNSFIKTEEMREERFHGCPLCHGSVMFLKSQFLRAGRYDPTFRIVSDYDLWIRMLNLGPMEKVPRVLYQYRLDPRSHSLNNWTKTCNDIMTCSAKYIKEYYYPQDEPSFLVIGPKKGCSNFKKHVVPNSRLTIHSYLYKQSMDDLEAAFLQFQRKNIDGIMILDGPNSQSQVDFMIDKGMTLNRNLFKLQNNVM